MVTGNLISYKKGQYHIESKFLWDSLLDLSMKTGFTNYRIFSIAYKLYKKNPGLYDIFGDELLALKTYQQAAQAHYITYYPYLQFLGTKVTSSYRWSKSPWLGFPTTINKILTQAIDHISNQHGMIDGSIDLLLQHNNFKDRLTRDLLLSIWEGGPLDKPTIDRWILHVTSMVFCLSAPGKEEEIVGLFEKFFKDSISKVNVNEPIITWKEKKTRWSWISRWF